MAGASVSLWFPQSFCGGPRDSVELSVESDCSQSVSGLSSLDGPIFTLGLSVRVLSIADENIFQGYATMYICAITM